MKKFIWGILVVVLFLYVVLCLLLYFFQEKLIFFPDKLAANYTFGYKNAEEVLIQTADNVQLNGLLFKAERSRGVIFYLHGNAGSLRSWGDVAKTYTSMHYDVFMLDYRGYGKSEGEIKSEKQMFDDVQTAYDNLKEIYDENNIIVLGYSIGTGLAAKVASENKPKRLILQAPYYSLTDMMRNMFPIVPTFILKYKFQTNEFIKNCTMPVTIFHGENDEVIYFGSSLKLKPLLKTTDKLIALKGQGHNGMSDNPDYLVEMEIILTK